jgi:predicted DCC family thiol-disulfide oxidoreductase YuxK
MTRPADGRHLLLFDGVCALCSTIVQFVLDRDRRRVFDFAPLQSAAAQEILGGLGRDPGALDTFYIVRDYHAEHPAALERADAALFLANALGWPWKAAGVLRVLPAFARNGAYNFVARHRYRIFGQRDQCFLPRPEDRTRFIGE